MSSSIPAARQRSRSPCLAFAVSAMIQRRSRRSGQSASIDRAAFAPAAATNGGKATGRTGTGSVRNNAASTANSGAGFASLVPSPASRSAAAALARSPSEDPITGGIAAASCRGRISPARVTLSGHTRRRIWRGYGGKRGRPSGRTKSKRRPQTTQLGRPVTSGVAPTSPPPCPWPAPATARAAGPPAPPSAPDAPLRRDTRATGPPARPASPRLG